MSRGKSGSMTGYNGQAVADTLEHPDEPGPLQVAAAAGRLLDVC